MTATVMFALASSLFFGVGDFLGGLATRRESAFVVAATSHAVSIAIMGAALVVLPSAQAGLNDLAWGAVSGVAGAVGVLCLYAALAVGRMSVVAPVSAALSASLPALYDVVAGTSLSALTIAGIAIALLAIVIVSIAPDDPFHEPGHVYRPRQALGLAALSGAGFSCAFIALSFTSADSGITPVLAARVISIAISLVLALRVGHGFPVARSALAPTVAAGVTDALANVTMLMAIRIGPLAIASVLGSLFPVVVVSLARLVLKERLHVVQKLGVAMALVAILLSVMR